MTSWSNKHDHESCQRGAGSIADDLKLSMLRAQHISFTDLIAMIGRDARPFAYSIQRSSYQSCSSLAGFLILAPTTRSLTSCPRENPGQCRPKFQARAHDATQTWSSFSRSSDDTSKHCIANGLSILLYSSSSSLLSLLVPVSVALASSILSLTQPCGWSPH